MGASRLSTMHFQTPPSLSIFKSEYPFLRQGKQNGASGLGCIIASAHTHN